MKIKDMTTKTSLEVQDTDLLVIEDEDDTKSITVEAFKEFLNISSDANTTKIVKQITNTVIDNVINALSSTKFILSELRHFMINTWIGSTSGNIQIAIKDIDNDKWLTGQDIIELMEIDQDSQFQVAKKDFTIRVKIAGVYQTAVSYSVREFNVEHENPHDVNAVLSDANAAFIKAHFDNLTQNDIAAIKYDDIEISFPSSEEYRYEFQVDEGSFANAVPYIESV